MLERTNKLDHRAGPDYELDEVLTLTTPEQFSAITGGVRPRILGLLSQRAASVSQIAETLGLSKGTTGHHIKVLESAGLVRVVRTRQVRALVEKYYGRTASTFRVSTDECLPGVSGAAIPREVFVGPLRQAISEFAPSTGPDDPSEFMLTHARMSTEDAREFVLRLEALYQEFGSRSSAGEDEKMYGFVAGVYLASRPELPKAAEEEDSD